MHPAISCELATAQIADLRRQAQRDALARATTRAPSSAPQPEQEPDRGQPAPGSPAAPLR